MKFDLSAFSPDQLDAMISQAKEHKKRLAKRRSPAIVRARLIATAAEYGYTIEEVLGEVAVVADKAPKKRRSALKGTKAAVKYRDPEFKRNTWSGRGSMPRWLAEKVKRGKSATDYLLPGLAKPTQKKSQTMGQKTVFKQG